VKTAAIFEGKPARLQGGRFLEYQVTLIRHIHGYRMMA
jgi:hypothetical protein